MSILTWDEALEYRRGCKLVFTNGIFDILHAGHVWNLQEARERGDMLLVGLNTDESVEALRGPNKPINRLEDRAAVIAALRCVDGVVAFSDLTPCLIIQHLRPEVHVKGGDYRIEEMAETPFVRAYGGEIVILPRLPGYSTTSTLDKLKS